MKIFSTFGKDLFALFVMAFFLNPNTLMAQEPKSSDVVVHEHDITGVVVKITELKRTANDTVTLRWTYVNMSEGEVKLVDTGYNYTLARDHYLLDLAGKKQYFPLTSNGNPLGRKHPNQISLKPGQEYAMWVRFPAPPAAVKKVDIYIDKVGEPFEGLTILE